MAERLTIWLQRAQNGSAHILLKEPLDDPDAELGVELTLAPEKRALLDKMKTGPWDPDIVEQVGTELCERLKSQPAIQRDFVRRLGPNGPADAPIYLHIDPPEIDEWPWEALSDPNTGFLALERRWPIARVKRVNTKVKPEYVFVPPLRIMAVLGASGADPQSRISAVDEWRELYDAVKQSPLHVQMRVWVCEDELLGEVEQLGESWITAGFLQDDRELFADVRSFGPQLLHFFCHGIADKPPFLQIATRSNWKRKEEGSINVEASQLRTRADLDQNVWLITLNCCESAQQAPGGGSRSRPMASSLALHGFPAVVGMRERVDSQHASRFCGLWYEALLRELETRFVNAQTGVEPDPFHWGTGLFAARQGICTLVEQVPHSQSARRRIEWTIPVLYTRDEPFTVRLAADATHPVLRADSAPAAPVVAAPAPVPPAPVAPAPEAPKPQLTVQDKLRLVATIQELLDARDKLAAQTNLPEQVRTKVLADIATEIASIEQQLT